MRIPSKTYLLGEYIVLDAEPCLILNTPPYFKVNIDCNYSLPFSSSLRLPRFARNDDKNGGRAVTIDFTHKKQVHSFHPQSSAGLWLQKNAHFFENTQIDFFDPHEGKGGFGASGAEFLAVYTAQHAIQKNIDWLEKMLASYWGVVGATNGILPSGADLVAQACGSENADPQSDALLSSTIVYWHRAKKRLDNVTWSFPDLRYCLIRSGYKCPTHQNIKKIPSHIVSEMSQVVEEGYRALQSKNAAHFVDSVKNYADWMKKEGCLFEKTEELIQFLYRSNLIEVAKGCGALGADVILVLLHSEKMPAFLAWLEAYQLDLCVSSEDHNKDEI